METKTAMGETSCTDCFRGFFRVILVIVNIFVTLLGFLVLVVGIWAKVKGDDYFNVISDNKDIVGVSVLLIVIGLFVVLLGIGGTAGAIFAGTVFGRIVIGVYAFILALLVICEIAGGIAAAVKKNDLNSTLQQNLLKNFREYNTSNSVMEAWNTTQKGLKCCGYNNYTDYSTFFNYADFIPSSCCGYSTETCLKDDTSLYTRGCYQEVSDYFSKNLSVVAGVGITFGFLQIIGVVVSCFVAIAGTGNANTYQTV